MKNPLKKLTLGLLCFSWIGFTASAGETLVGELEDDLKVNNLGTAGYTLPLVVSPGTAGMQPKLAITYSSRGGNGPLGIGFSLSGLNAISRAPASFDQDGFVDPVDYDEHDRFLLNGQRLELVSTTNLSLYGTAGTEYRTEIDSFQRVRAHGQQGSGPASFTVSTKTGLHYTYGATPNARFQPEEHAGVYRWGVSLSDTPGNYMTFTYTDPAETGRPLIERIDYTGNGADKSPYSAVEFIYETRPDTLYRAVLRAWMRPSGLKKS